MDDKAADFLNAALKYANTKPTPHLLLVEHDATKQVLTGTKSVETALFFSSLLLNPEYQANCVRLVALVHLCLASRDGDKSVSPEQIGKCFNDLNNGRCGIREDPIEDVFVGNVITADGNFRVLEGTGESGTFFLQRFLDILATTPEEGIFTELRSNTHALLTLSDGLCSRFSLERYVAGAVYPKTSLDLGDVSRDIAQNVVFSDSDLDSLGINKADLQPFILMMEYRNRLSDIPIEHSPVQQLPLIETEDGIAFALPSATTYAIRMLLTRRMIESGNIESLTDRLAASYRRLFRNTPIVGIPRNVSFTGSELRIAEALEEIDTGRFIQYLFIVDSFDNIKASGVTGNTKSMIHHADKIHERIQSAISLAKMQPEYRKGRTLIVDCGIGRGSETSIPKFDDTWTIHGLSAPDLITLAWTRDFDLLKLWKAIEAVDKIADAGVQLMNNNGILNLIGWMKSNEWQILPHSQVPKDIRLGGGYIALAPNFLFDLRHDTTQTLDRVGIHHPTMGVIPCRKRTNCYFAADDEIPIYMPENFAPKDGILFAYLSKERTWWCVVTTSHLATLHDHWKLMCTWLPKIVQAIEQHTPDLPETILIKVNFSNTLEDIQPQPIMPTTEEIHASVSWTADLHNDAINMTIGRAFNDGTQAATNVSESALVSEMCSAVLDLAGVELSNAQREMLQRSIIPSEHARFMHAFSVKAFRDVVGTSLNEMPIELDDLDSSSLRIGLAFRIEPREKGRFSTRNKKQSTKLLNGIVAKLEAELCSLVGQFNRQKLIEMAMVNHERAIFSQQRWMRTAFANISLRPNEDKSRDVITQKDSDLKSVIFLSRIIAEFAICESQISNGLTPGQIDFTRMMNLVSVINQFGGWSDAIHMDVMPPGLMITALGDIQADHNYYTDILMPFSQMHSMSRVDNSIKDFAKNYQAHTTDSPSFTCDPQFQAAWKKEYGTSLDDLRAILDALEDIGIEKNEAVFCVQKSKLLTALSDFKSIDVERVLDAFTLHPRKTWRTVPAGYEEKDIQPWRYRRQLSTIRRPIMQVDDSQDPRLIVVPGFIRECVAYVVNNYFEGTFPSRHYRTDVVKEWHNRRRKKRSKEFVESVSAELSSHGWECLTEQNMRTMVQCNSDTEYGDMRRYGDVDVVAWNTAQRRLLLIECKHLYLGKTTGEIAEQLSDYRGDIREDGRKKKRDDLRKHLDRLKILHARRDEVCRTLKIDSSTNFEGWIVFKNPVPMLFAWNKFEGKVQIATFDDIPRLASVQGDA